MTKKVTVNWKISKSIK